MSKRRIKSSAEMMEKTARAFRLRGLIDRHRLFAIWEQIVGKRLYAVCRPERLLGDTLVIRVVDSVWGQELKMFTDDILARITECTGNDVVKKLRLVTGPIETVETKPALPPLDSIEVETADIQSHLQSSRLAGHPRLRRLLSRIWANTRRIHQREVKPEP